MPRYKFYTAHSHICVRVMEVLELPRRGMMDNVRGDEVSKYLHHVTKHTVPKMTEDIGSHT